MADDLANAARILSRAASPLGSSSSSTSNTTSSNTSTLSNASFTGSTRVDATKELRTLFPNHFASGSSSSNPRAQARFGKRKRSSTPKTKEVIRKFVCLADKDQSETPNPEENRILLMSGLGECKISVPEEAVERDIRGILINQFPQLKDAGGFEFMYSESRKRKLRLIPPGPNGLSMKYIVSFIGQGKVFIRPIQTDLSLVSGNNCGPEKNSETCRNCGESVDVGSLRDHCSTCPGGSLSNVQAAVTSEQPTIHIGDKIEDGHINIEYRRYKSSLYNNGFSVSVTASREDCWLAEEREFQESCDSENDMCPESYDPVDSNWVMSTISKGDIVYLESSGEYPIDIKINGVEPETKSLIAYGPDDICGVMQSSSTNSGNVVLGCLATKHTEAPGNMMYSWYHNDTLLKQGKKACLLYVFHPGKYKCKLTLGNQHQFSREVDVFYSSKDIKIASADPGMGHDSGMHEQTPSSSDDAQDNRKECASTSHTDLKTKATAQMDVYNTYLTIIDDSWIEDDDDDPEFIAAVEASLKDQEASTPYQGDEDKESVSDILIKFVTANLQNNTDIRCNIVISRKAILQSTIRAIQRKTFSFFRPLVVTFAGEEGVDEGGPKREFLRLLMVALSQSSMFQGPWLSHDLNLLSSNKYNEIGKLIAWSVLQGGNGPRCLSGEGYNIIRGCAFDKVSAIKAVYDADMKSILEALDAATSEKDFSECKNKYSDAIAQYGYSRIYTSNLENKEEIMKSLLQQYFTYGVHSEFMQLLDGMNSIGNFGNIMMAHKSVFDAVLGNKQEKLTASKFKSLFKVDYAEKGSNMRNKEDSTMYCFEVFLVDLEEGEADGVALEDLLIFITGVESPPPLGFDSPLTIQFYDFIGKERRRPSSSTCSLTLDLPRGMEDPDEFKSLMRDSILESHGFGKG